MVELATHSVATVANERERERCTVHTHTQCDDFTFNYTCAFSVERLNQQRNIYIIFTVCRRSATHCTETFAFKRMPVRCLSHLLLSNSNRIEYRFRCHLSCRIVIITFLYSQYPHIPLTFGKMSGAGLRNHPLGCNLDCVHHDGYTHNIWEEYAMQLSSAHVTVESQIYWTICCKWSCKKSAHVSSRANFWSCPQYSISLSMFKLMLLTFINRREIWILY